MKYVKTLGGFSVAARALQKSAMLATAVIFATGASAENQPVSYVLDSGASERIDSAGKLRMLSQRIVATACFAHAGVETDAATAMLIESTQEFRLITQALEFGNPDLGINGAETDVKTRATIAKLHDIWDPIAIVADKVVSGSATQEEITQIALQSEPLLEKAQTLVAAVTAEYSQGVALVMRDAMAIDIAGRQRMLAQRISKDVCLLATGIDAEHAADDLTQTTEIFDASLSALRGGLPSAGIQAPTDEQVIADLEVTIAHWATVQTKVADALSGEPISNDRLAVMFELANVLTADMNKVVTDYTQASKESM